MGMTVSLEGRGEPHASVAQGLGLETTIATCCVTREGCLISLG